MFVEVRFVTLYCFQKIIICNLVVSIVVFHICIIIIKEAPDVLVELNDGSIIDIHIYCGVNLCVKCDAESTRNLRKR